MAAVRSSSPRLGFSRARLKPLARALLLAQFAAPVMLIGWPADVLHAQQVSVVFDIPSGPLDQALVSFGRQSGVGISADAALTDGLRSAGLHGRYAPNEALPILLSGTGLVARIDGGTAVLQRAGRTGARTTDPLRVRGDGEASVGGEQRDIRGYDNVYDLDISTTYIGKEAIDRYKGTNPADIFKGMTGVYSGEARNSGAIDINIRGIQGPGRIPVTIDGTEQALTVYRGYNGASNRNYIDPFLIGGVQVVKGPSLTRNVKSGIGGSVTITTLTVADVLNGGETFGGDIRVEGSSNSTNPRLPTLHTGEDYTTVEGFPQTNPSSPYADQTLRVVNRTGGGGYNVFAGGDYAYRVALGWKPRDDFDLLAAYAYRERGNYYSGKHNAGYYSGAPSTYIEDYISTLATYFKPGSEVPNTSSQSESWLFKATWRPTDDQALQLGYRSSLLHYGEIMPSRIANSDDRSAIQWPLSRVDSTAWNLEYKWRPEDSRWIDLYANVWRTNTVSDTYTGGGFPNFATYSDPILRNEALTNATNSRNGITLSNKFRLMDSLDLTVGGNFQHEKLRSNEHFDSSYSSWKSYPRAGRRQEWEGNFNFEWRPLDFLTLTGGARYVSYWAFDDFQAAHEGQIATAYVTGRTVTYTSTEQYTEEQMATRAASFLWIYDWLLAGGALTQAQYDAQVAALYKDLGTTYQATHTAPAWLPDSNGNYDLSTLACVNGSLDGVANYNAGSCGVQNITQIVYPSATKRKGHGWAPAFSATVNFSDYSRAYLRYTETKRYPSLFESTIAFSAGFSQYPLKPEHGRNIELAYVHDLGQFLSSDTQADVKLAYYVNKTRDVIERDNDFRFDNIDKQIIRGIELTGRYDNGRFFTDLGLNYQLQNKVCDKSTAALINAVYGLANYNNGIVMPNCVKYGFAGGYLLTMATPDFSANWSLGGRFLQNRLEIGGRFTYWNQYKNSDLDFYREHAYSYGGNTSGWNYGFNVPYSWGKTVLVDAYAKYRIRDDLTSELTVTNLTDQYYVDVSTRSAMAAPGRTLKLSINYQF
jgi:hemoglobin/transferrin/lactoferrin receptor protein